MYKRFMRHAKNLTDSEVAKASTKQIIRGVKHYEDGSLAVTDSHRLYFVKDMHDKGDCVITPSGQKLEGNYPEIKRLFPESWTDSLVLDTRKWLQAVELKVTAAKLAMKDNKEEVNKNFPVIWEEDMLSYLDLNIKAKTQIEDVAPGKIALNVFYLHHALQLFDIFKYGEFEVRYNGSYFPLVLLSRDEKVQVVLLPIRGKGV